VHRPSRSCRRQLAESVASGRSASTILRSTRHPGRARTREPRHEEAGAPGDTAPSADDQDYAKELAQELGYPVDQSLPTCPDPRRPQTRCPPVMNVLGGMAKSHGGPRDAPQPFRTTGDRAGDREVQREYQQRGTYCTLATAAEIARARKAPRSAPSCRGVASASSTRATSPRARASPPRAVSKRQAPSPIRSSRLRNARRIMRLRPPSVRGAREALENTEF